MEFRLALDIARTCHAHPTLTEAVKEAALAVEDPTAYVSWVYDPARADACINIAPARASTTV